MIAALRKALVPFDDVSSSTPGVLFKAGLQSSAATDAGIGVTGTLQGVVGTNFTFTKGGIQKILGTSGYYVGYTLSAAENPQAYSTLPHSGTIQFEALKSDLMTLGAALAAQIIMRIFDGTSTYYGPTILTEYAAHGTTNSYRDYSDGYGGITVYDDAMSFRSGSGFAVTENPQACVHQFTETNAAGFVTMSLSYDPYEAWWLVNGIPVARFRRKKFAPPATIYLRLLENVCGGLTLRNLLVLNSPRKLKIILGGKYRVVMCMHSFGTTATGVMETEINRGFYLGGTQPSYGAQEALASSIYRHMDEDVSIINVSYGGKNTDWMATMAADGAEPYVAPNSYAVASASRSGSATVVALCASHPFQVGDMIAPTGANEAAYNKATGTTVTAVGYTAGVPTSYSYDSGASATDSATGAALIVKPYSNKARISQHRAHFVIFSGHMNDHSTSIANMKTRVKTANAACIARGEIPIWLMEQNGDLADAAYDQYTNGVAEAIRTACTEDAATYGDVGFVDGMTSKGGAHVQAQYVQNKVAPLSSAVHANWKSQEMDGIALAAEIKRLAANPPAYSKLVV